MRSRLLASLAALALAVGVIAPATVAPLSTADAAGTRVGTIRVQVQTIAGADWHKKDFVVSASGMKVDYYKEAETDARGVAVLKVPQGKYTITVLSYRSHYRYAVVRQDYIAIQRGQVKTIGMTMYKGAQITGRALTPGGSALRGAQVAAVDRTGVLRAVTTTDRRGRFRLAGLSTGKYAVIFNYRSWADGTSKAADAYGWGYYKGTDLASAKYLRVYQQNKYADATKTTGVTGAARSGTPLTVNLSTTVTPSARLLVDRISSTGRYLQSDSVYAPFEGGSTRTLKVEPGKYRLGVSVGGIDYYYTGDGLPLTRTLSDAVYTHFTDAPLTVAFGPIP